MLISQVRCRLLPSLSVRKLDGRPELSGIGLHCSTHDTPAASAERTTSSDQPSESGNASRARRPSLEVHGPSRRPQPPPSEGEAISF